MYGFKIKFRASESCGIFSNSTLLSFFREKSDCEIKISTGQESIPLKKAKKLYISSNGFKSAEEAEYICSITSQALTTTSALLDLGFDIPRISMKKAEGDVHWNIDCPTGKKFWWFQQSNGRPQIFPIGYLMWTAFRGRKKYGKISDYWYKFLVRLLDDKKNQIKSKPLFAVDILIHDI